MSGDDVVGVGDQDGISESKLLNAGSNLADLDIAMRPAVPCIGDQLLDVYLLNFGWRLFLHVEQLIRLCAESQLMGDYPCVF